MNQVAYIIDRNAGSITIYVGVKPYTIEKSHTNYEMVMQKLKDKDYNDLEKLLDIPLAISIASNGKVIVENGAVFYNGEEIHNILVDRILEFMNKDFPFEPLVLFLENLLQNPNKETINELYLFLENGHNPITDDGCFLAYKKVDNDLRSYHISPDGTYIQHVVGQPIEMNRDDVNTNRNQTCSEGLHFCSLSYLPKYHCSEGKVIILKINPKDVCSIPSDYNNTKGRACCYEVVAEYDSTDCESTEAFEDSYIDTTVEVREQMVHVRQDNSVKDVVVVEETKTHNLRGSDGRFIPNYRNSFGVKPDGKRYHNVRGASGKFIKKR